MRPWSLAGWLLALVAVAFLVVETRAVAEEAGRLELDLRSARAEIARRDAVAVTPPAPESPAPAVEATAYAQLAIELATTKEQLAAVKAVLESRNQMETERAQRAVADAERRNKAMPEGVRECLLALHECLRAEGFLGPRFLRAETVGKEGLGQVEMLEPDAAGLDVAVVQAARMTATVERATGRFVLRFYDGERSVRGVAKPLPEDGHALAFADVDGRRIEERLPYLVAVEGEYPPPTAAPGRAPGELDPIQRRQWVERLDAVLAQGGGAPRWRVQRLRGLLDGWFLGVELVGVDDKRHVVAGASCERLAIELDEAAGVVSLRLCDGSLRRSGVDSSITGEGLRMLLPAMNCKQATDAMFGMVARR